jgi:hypothetical protein
MRIASTITAAVRWNSKKRQPGMNADNALRWFFNRYIRWRLEGWGIRYIDENRLGDPVRYWIPLEYPITPSPRYGHGKDPHRPLHEIIARDDNQYSELLGNLSEEADDFAEAMERDASTVQYDPINVWFTGLDAFALYGILVTSDPARYIEIGSGNSTRIAALAKARRKLRTEITSVDPCPRADVDELCDHVIRQPAEEADLRLIEDLDKGDVLFVDNSHRCFTNSDVTVFFLDMLPRLRSGVLVHIHDIWLPNDYPPHWSPRHYSEQYLLASWLLAEGSRFRLLLPCAYVSASKIFQPLLDRIWDRPTLKRMRLHALQLMYGMHGLSFWLEMR